MSPFFKRTMASDSSIDHPSARCSIEGSRRYYPERVQKVREELPVRHRSVVVPVAEDDFLLERVLGGFRLVYRHAEAGLRRGNGEAALDRKGIGQNVVTPGDITADRFLDQVIRRGEP